jgi:hypothetical protein
MTDEQKAAFVNAQAAMLNAKVAAMTAENQHRLSLGQSVAFGETEFHDTIQEYECVIGHNACIELFHDLKRG